MTHAFPNEKRQIISSSLLPIIKHLLRVLECLDFLFPLGHTLRVCLLSLDAHWFELLELCEGVFLELGGMTFVLLCLHKLIIDVRDACLFGADLVVLVFVVSLGICFKSFKAGLSCFLRSFRGFNGTLKI